VSNVEPISNTRSVLPGSDSPRISLFSYTPFNFSFQNGSNHYSSKIENRSIHNSSKIENPPSTLPRTTPSEPTKITVQKESQNNNKKKEDQLDKKIYTQISQVVESKLFMDFLFLVKLYAIVVISYYCLFNYSLYCIQNYY